MTMWFDRKPGDTISVGSEEEGDPSTILLAVESHIEGLEKSKIPKTAGACTAVVVGSILYPEDGSYSAAFLTVDGRTGTSLHDNELWKAWSLLAVQLSRSDTLSEHKRELCALVWDTICAGINVVIPEPENK